MHEWLEQVADALDTSPGLVQRHSDALLDMVRVVAHGPSRPAAPLTAFLLGQLTARSSKADADLEKGLRVVHSLLAGRDGATKD